MFNALLPLLTRGQVPDGMRDVDHRVSYQSSQLMVLKSFKIMDEGIDRAQSGAYDVPASFRPHVKPATFDTAPTHALIPLPKTCFYPKRCP